MSSEIEMLEQRAYEVCDNWTFDEKTSKERMIA
jgi:hypothetical protein